MFGNRSFNVKMVKDQPTVKYTDKAGNDSFVTHFVTPEQISELVTETAVTAAKLYTGIKLVKTACNLIEIAAKAFLK